jgi:hypothetical protein
MISRQKKEAGFALPSIIISALVMFTIVTTLVGSVSSVKVALDTQYYRSLARDAAESGANYAKVCLYEPTFVQGDSIDPTKTCKKTSSGMSQYLIDNTASVGSTKFRTTYTANLLSATNDGKRLAVTGKVQLIRSSDSSVWREYTWVTNVQMTKKIDSEGDRASKRYWYFGKHAGLDFGRTGNAMPTPVYFPVNAAEYSASGGNPYGAGEGATVTNDQNGNLQFWSNGLNIWNKDGKKMTDVTGDAAILKGHNSATQAGISFPMNSSRTKYGVVSNSSAGEVGDGELYLHTIDMNLDGGNGAIISKNRPLSKSNQPGYSLPSGMTTAANPDGTTSQTNYAAEGESAMPNADGSGYYVYTYHSGPNARMMKFYVGMDGSVQGGTPINFNSMPAYCSDPGLGIYGYGGINFNKDYSLMLVAVGTWSCASSMSGTLYLYQTDRTNGNLTQLASWTVENDYLFAASEGSHSVYEAEFSPSDRYVYVTNLYPGRLTRYDITSKNSATIKSTEWDVPSKLTTVTDTNVTPSDRNSGGHIRTGPDGRMYIADNAWGTSRSAASGGGPQTPPYKMSYINTPDSQIQTLSSIGLNIDGITLPYNPNSGAYTYTVWSLPQMVTVYIPEIIVY